MIIAIDFDGTLCKDSNFPQIGEPKLEIILWAKKQKQLGYKLILQTCREEPFTTIAVEWCKQFGLVFDSVNENLLEFGSNHFGKHKVIADIYLDDKSMKLSEIGMSVESFMRGQ